MSNIFRIYLTFLITLFICYWIFFLNLICNINRMSSEIDAHKDSIIIKYSLKP